MNKQYVDELIGIPRYELIDEDLVNAFYELNNEEVIIRCIFEKDNILVGYIITVNNINSSIKFPHPARHLYKDLEYGNGTIEDIGYNGYYDEIKGNLGNDIAYNYYWECHHLSNIEDSNGFIIAILPYGFWEDDSWHLMQLITDSGWDIYNVLEEDNNINKEIFNYRKILHPNTFGIINVYYCDRINPYIKNDDMMSYWSACVNDFTNLKGQ